MGYVIEYVGIIQQYDSWVCMKVGPPPHCNFVDSGVRQLQPSPNDATDVFARRPEIGLKGSEGYVYCLRCPHVLSQHVCA